MKKHNIDYYLTWNKNYALSLAHLKTLKENIEFVTIKDFIITKTLDQK